MDKERKAKVKEKKTNREKRGELFQGSSDGKGDTWVCTNVLELSSLDMLRKLMLSPGHVSILVLRVILNGVVSGLILVLDGIGVMGWSSSWLPLDGSLDDPLAIIFAVIVVVQRKVVVAVVFVVKFIQRLRVYGFGLVGVSGSVHGRGSIGISVVGEDKVFVPGDDGRHGRYDSLLAAGYVR
ncbi:hypothetical protein BKA57DRAFT_461571 [Linnemannia elongata]|nr:hypothetical protein BKA57DRAFT_461571 [Linnemannia elongata]